MVKSNECIISKEEAGCLVLTPSTAYYVENVATLTQCESIGMRACPINRYVGDYQYVNLSDLSAEQLALITRKEPGEDQTCYLDTDELLTMREQLSDFPWQQRMFPGPLVAGAERIERMQDYRNLDLHNRNFSRMRVIRNCDFTGANLDGCDFSNVRFENCIFNEANMRYTIFRNTKIRNCRFNNTMMNNSTWRKVTIRGSTFRSTYFSNAVLQVVDSYGSLYQGCVYERAQLRALSYYDRSIVKQCTFLDAEISHMRFCESDIEDNSTFVGAKVDSFTLDEMARATSITKLYFLNLQARFLHDFPFASIAFIKPDITGAHVGELAFYELYRLGLRNFREAYIVNTDLEKSNVRDCDFTEATFQGCDLSGAVVNIESLVSANFYYVTLSAEQFIELYSAGRRNFDRVKIVGGNLSRYSFDNVSFKHGLMDNVCLNGTEFHDSDFEEAELKEVSANNAVFQNTRFKKTKITHSAFWDAVFNKPNMTDAKITKSGFAGATFEEPIMTDAKISQCGFEGTIFEGIPEKYIPSYDKDNGQFLLNLIRRDVAKAKRSRLPMSREARRAQEYLSALQVPQEESTVAQVYEKMFAGHRPSSRNSKLSSQFDFCARRNGELEALQKAMVRPRQQRV